jgi:hypothetical protein
MSLPTPTTTTNPPIAATHAPPTIVHQIRMELMLEADTLRINVGKIMFGLFNKVHALGTVTFLDTHRKEITKDNFPHGQDFIERMMMTQVPSGRKKKIIVGFFISSKLSLADIKRGIGYNWLHEQNIYLRSQNMLFDHGIDLFLIGYWIKEHPSFMNLAESPAAVMEHWNEMFDIIGHEDDIGKEEPSKEEADIKELFNHLTSNKILVNGKLNIPVSLERNLVKVEGSDIRKPFEAFAINVYVPREFREIATKMNDYALSQPSSTTILPFALQKHEPAIFHDQMTQHAKYLHTHRNMVIDGVDAHNYELTYNTELIHTTDEQNPDKSITHEPNSISLKKLLTSNPLLYRIYTRDDEKLNISVEGENFGIVARWLDHILASFTAYRPMRIPPTNSTSYSTTSGSKKTDATSKYSHLSRFSTGTDHSFDASTLSSKSARTATWNSSRYPTEVLVDHISEFPALVRPLSTVHEEDEHPTAHARSVSSPHMLQRQAGYHTFNPQNMPRTGGGRGAGVQGSPHSAPRSYLAAVSQTLTRDYFPLESQGGRDEDLLSESISKSEAAMTARLDKIEAFNQQFAATINTNFAKFEEALVRLTTTIHIGSQSTTTTTDHSVNSSTTSDHTYMTRADATSQYERTHAKMDKVHAAQEEQMNGLQNTLDALILKLVAIAATSDNGHSPDTTVASPPRKIRIKDHFNPADSPMDIEEGASAD